MAQFAEIKNNLVTQIIVIDDADCGGGNFPESEPIGQSFIASIGLGSGWLQTSEDGMFRGIYAGIGYTYDSDLDEFIAPPQPTEEIPE